MNRRAKIIHENLNTCGGSERLTLSVIEVLNDLNYLVDLETTHIPDWKIINKSFGNKSIKINKIKKINLESILGDLYLSENIPSNHDINDYELIINTHGDILPYYPITNSKYINFDNTCNKMITYCHFPLLPYYIKYNKFSSYLINLMYAITKDLNNQKEILSLIFDKYSLNELEKKALKRFNLMIENSQVITNSNFSKLSIEDYFRNKPLRLSIINPPVDIKKFKIRNSEYSTRTNRIVVISRYSPDKEIEKAIRIAKNLNQKYDFSFEMLIVGNMTYDNYSYYRFLQTLLKSYDLNSKVKLLINLDINKLSNIINNSKIILHPTKGEPFGIAIVEGISAGLIPIVPSKGGCTEFVPSCYHYNNEEEASNLIINSLDITTKERDSLAKEMTAFSEDNFKDNMVQFISNKLISQNKQIMYNTIKLKELASS